MDKPNFKSIEKFCDLSHHILQYANQGTRNIDFIRKTLKLLIDFSKCSAIELRTKEEEDWLCYEVTYPKYSFQIDINNTIPSFTKNKNIFRESKQFFMKTKKGSFWTGNAPFPFDFDLGFDHEDEDEKKRFSQKIYFSGDYSSLGVIPLLENNVFRGFLLWKSNEEDFFIKNEIEFYEHLSEIFTNALRYSFTQAALHERIKEMTCLHEMTKMAEIENISLKEILQKVVEILPPAWQYPEITHARILLDEDFYSTSNFCHSQQKLSSDIVVRGENRGTIEVFYLEKKELQNFFSRDKVFLKEELYLIKAVSQQLALIIERLETKEEKNKLQEQLRHSDRLATIGQLASGVAHELNEPLVHILGFAQLTLKASDLPKQAQKDIEKILSASLHAREIIKKLLLFARQTQTEKTQVDLNKIIDEGIYFLEARCSKHEIEIIRSFSDNLPEITADPSQLHQVIINLIVNSIQAMPEGGKITIKTLVQKNKVSIILRDTGKGMSEEIRQKIFLPFFTTKEINEGTGLGLAVVHGIITSHKGSIEVESKVDVGSQFEINFPIS